MVRVKELEVVECFLSSEAFVVYIFNIMYRRGLGHGSCHERVIMSSR